LPAKLTDGLNSLAVRLPKNDFLIKIINEVDFPIVSTSLNKRGEKSLTNVQNLEKHFKYLPDLAIDAQECKRTKPSRLVDLRDIKNIKIIRK
jgi:L-threonylcarbamoyladenylate synthase